ncbi:MAG: universal stress protein [Chloroflexi bacterium]|nr:universal stress protein [Chloroflexota bacterium]
MAIQTILVPLDGSRLARRALPTAAALARLLGARLHLVSVADASQLDLEFFYQAQALPISQEIQFRLVRYLEKLQSALQRGGLTVQTEVVFGRPSEEILRAAERAGADIIALSTHGRSGLGRWAQGSVASEVIRSSPTPVLVLRPDASSGAPSSFSRILTPLDGSAVAEAALPLAADLANAAGATLVLAEAVPTLTDLALGPLWSIEPEGMEAQAQAAVAAYLEETARPLKARGITVETKVLQGEPARELLKLAEEDAISIIVMATHGRTGWRRWLLGSVADRVVREAGRPVLLAHPQGAAQS